MEWSGGMERWAGGRFVLGDKAEVETRWRRNRKMAIYLTFTWLSGTDTGVSLKSAAVLHVRVT
jgi:hypothetical protein